jgi:hypothetical protein
MVRKKLFITIIPILITCFLILEQAFAEDNSNREYTSDRFLTATGIGQSDSEARRMAKAEMSTIFEAKIESEIASNIKSVTASESMEEFQKKTESHIKIKSDVQLQGVEIGKTWFDEDTGSHYAVAVLDRYKARDQWSEGLETLEGTVDLEYKRLENNKSPILRLASAKKIYGLLLEVVTLKSRLRVIGFPDVDSSEHNLGSMVELASNIKNKMLIQVDIKGDRSLEVAGEISQHLTQHGYKLTSMSEKADVLISGTVKTEPVKLRNPGWEFSRAIISLAVIDVMTNNEVQNIKDSVRKGHVDYNEASREASMKAAQEVSEKFLAHFDF